MRGPGKGKKEKKGNVSELGVKIAGERRKGQNCMAGKNSFNFVKRGRLPRKKKRFV